MKPLWPLLLLLGAAPAPEPEATLPPCAFIFAPEPGDVHPLETGGYFGHSNPPQSDGEMQRHLRGVA